MRAFLMNRFVLVQVSLLPLAHCTPCVSHANDTGTSYRERREAVGFLHRKVKNRYRFVALYSYSFARGSSLYTPVVALCQPMPRTKQKTRYVYVYGTYFLSTTRCFGHAIALERKRIYIPEITPESGAHKSTYQVYCKKVRQKRDETETGTAAILRATQRQREHTKHRIKKLHQNKHLRLRRFRSLVLGLLFGFFR